VANRSQMDKTISSSIYFHHCIPKMKNEMLLFTFQQMLHPLLQNAVTLPWSPIPSGSLSSLRPISTNRHLSSPRLLHHRLPPPPPLSSVTAPAVGRLQGVRARRP
jgi:hypothetical protein